MLHTVEVTSLRVLDLTSIESLQGVGLTMADIEDDDHTACQEVGAAAHFFAHQGLRAPSATSQGVIIAVYPRHADPGQLGVVSSEAIELG